MTEPADVLTEEPLVSICVITYNHEPFIAQCLDSLIAQETKFSYEICVGEDESSDATREICQRYADEYPNKIRLFLRSRKDVLHVGGKPTGRNNYIKTLGACRGKYIAFCEGDDYWTDVRKLQLQVQALEENPQCALCYCNVQIVRDDGTPPYVGYAAEDKKPGEQRPGDVFVRPPTETDITRLATGNYVHTPGVVFRNWFGKQSGPEFMKTVPFGDWALHMCTARTGNLLYLDEVLSAYRVHAGGMWSCTSSMLQMFKTVRVACLMSGSGLFSDEVVLTLRNYSRTLVRRLWKLLVVNEVSDIDDDWALKLFEGDPDLRSLAERYARKYRWIGLYRFIRKVKGGLKTNGASEG